jgi:hypothetical protein
MKLDKGVRRQLWDGLKMAFSTFEQLRLMVNIGLNENLDGIMAPKGVDAASSELITWAEGQGRLIELVAAAAESAPENDKLKEVSQKIALPRKVAGERERIILKNVRFNDVDEWGTWLQARKRAVCRVEYCPGKGMGTGFLVGPDLVMTAGHVVEGMRQLGHQAGYDWEKKARVRFDYAVPVGRKRAKVGTAFELVPGSVVHESPENELDFALLRVQGEPGRSRPPAGASQRGWLTPAGHQFSDQEPVVIVQHPRGAAVKLSFGAVTSPETPEHRVIYTANTLDGSSGSPCFTTDFELAAIHTHGQVTGNLGVLFSAILAKLPAGVLSPAGTPAPS